MFNANQVMKYILSECSENHKQIILPSFPSLNGLKVYLHQALLEANSPITIIGKIEKRLH